MSQSLCDITFLPEGITVQVPKHTTVLQAALANGLPIESTCSGRGTCGKCLVKVSGAVSEPSAHENKKLGPKKEQGWRLACHTKVLGPTHVTLSEKGIFHTVQNGTACSYPFEPMIKEIYPASVPLYGLAIDIGTTSIVASLIDLHTSDKEIFTASCLNPQTQFGADVISRITFAHQSEEDTQRLTDAVVRGLNQLIKDLCAKANIDPHHIVHAVIAANTTMLHLLVGLDPISLAVAPYEPLFTDYQEYTAGKIGLNMNPTGVVSLLPSLSAFIGADIIAGLIAIDYHRINSPSLFIDIGTNGEIVANVNGQLAATSSAAGPALEGMNIHCGCRAEDGAISSVQITPDGEVIFKSIGTAPVKGLCGSGLVELVSELLKAQVITPSGKFADPAELPPHLARHLIKFDEQYAFVVDAPSQTILTQKDVRQVQLAKAAIAAAIEILLKRLKIELTAIKNIYIAGSFGYHLKAEALNTIGLLPKGLQAALHFVGNTAKEGARLCLCSKQALEEVKSLQKVLIPLELSYAPEFMEYYVRHMNFPI